MSTPVPDVVSRYFEFDGDRDIDSIVNLFTDDATERILDSSNLRRYRLRGVSGAPVFRRLGRFIQINRRAAVLLLPR